MIFCDITITEVIKNKEDNVDQNDINNQKDAESQIIGGDDDMSYDNIDDKLDSDNNNDEVSYCGEKVCYNNNDNQDNDDDDDNKEILLYEKSTVKNVDQINNEDKEVKNSSPGRPRNPRISTDEVDIHTIQQFVKNCVKTEISGLENLDIIIMEIVGGSSIDFSKSINHKLSGKGKYFIH